MVRVVSRRQEQRGSIVAVAENHSDVAAKTVGRARLEPVERAPPLWPEAAAPCRTLLPESSASAAASARSARRRVGRQSDGALQERGRGRDASARLRAAGGSLELEGDLLVGPGGGPGEVPGAPVRVSSRRRWRRPARDDAATISAAAERYEAERTSGCANSTRPPSRAARRPARDRPRQCRYRGVSAARWSSGGRRGALRPRRGRAAASRTGALEAPRVALFDLADDRVAAGRPNPPASSAAFQVRGSSSSASGLPWLSAMICSQTAASSGPCTSPAAARVHRCRRVPR